MKNIWDYLNGKKVMIGLFLLWICDKMWFKDFLPDGSVENMVVDLVFISGCTLAGIGVLHKGVKAVESYEVKK